MGVPKLPLPNSQINGCPRIPPRIPVPKLPPNSRIRREQAFREGEHQFRKSPEKCSRLSGMIAHLRPEQVFTFSQNDRSRWDGICGLKPINQ